MIASNGPAGAPCRSDDEPELDAALGGLALRDPEHALGQVQCGDLVTELGGEQRQRPGARANVQHARRRLRQGLPQRLTPRGGLERIADGVRLRLVVRV